MQETLNEEHIVELNELKRQLYDAIKGINALIDIISGSQRQSYELKSNEYSDMLLNIIQNYFIISLDELKSRSRKGEIPHARAIYWKILKDLSDNPKVPIKLSLAALGNVFNKDHATVLNGVKNVNNAIDCKEMVSKDNESINLYSDYIEIKGIFEKELDLIKINQNGQSQ